MGETDGQRLTRKGQATRERIIKVAADLIFEHGVAGTSVDDVRRVAGVSGSQMTHYFTDKRSLVRAVVAWQADTVIELHQLPVLGELDSFAALDLWAELYIARQKRLGCRGGCSFGSLAGELAETDDETREDLAQGFLRWEGLFRHGLRLMKRRGDLRPEANPDELAVGLLSALQGGMLLSRTMRDIRPVEAALKTIIAHVRSFAEDDAERVNTRRKPGTARRAARLVEAF
jgi:TetR/AcrR family transcriptional regulator, transcriptional repressor for nem operon